MVNTFQLNKKFSEWAEGTIYSYFKQHRKKSGLSIFFFGSQVDTNKRDKGDAPLRPDFILIKNSLVKHLQNKYHIDFYHINLSRLSKVVSLTKDDFVILKKQPAYWMTRINDNNELMKDIVKNCHCMLEVKSGQCIFDQDAYDEERANIMVPQDFKRRIKSIKRKFHTRFKVYVTYVMLDKAYIANSKKIFSKGLRPACAGGWSSDKKEYALPFKKSKLFAIIKGVVTRKRGDRIHIRAKPHFQLDGSKLSLSLAPLSLGKMKNVNVRVLKNLLD